MNRLGLLQAWKELPYFSDYKMHPPPNWVGKWGASYSQNVVYLAHWGWGEAVEQGHRRQEQGLCCRKLVAAGVGRCCGPWPGRRGCPGGRKQGRQERSSAVAYYSAREEGTGRAGSLGEESLWHPCVPPSRD